MSWSSGYVSDNKRWRDRHLSSFQSEVASYKSTVQRVACDSNADTRTANSESSVQQMVDEIARKVADVRVQVSELTKEAGESERPVRDLETTLQQVRNERDKAKGRIVTREKQNFDLNNKTEDGTHTSYFLIDRPLTDDSRFYLIIATVIIILLSGITSYFFYTGFNSWYTQMDTARGTIRNSFSSRGKSS